MKDNNRSEHFDYFSPQGDENKRKKSLMKKIWLWVRVVLYTLIFGITMTGCVQSMVVKSSTYTGGGVEFYLDKANIAPKIASFTVGKNNDKNDTFLNKDGFYKLEHLTEKNFDLDNTNYKTTLEGIQKQTANNGGEYGKYGSYSSSIQYIKRDRNFDTLHPIFFKNDKYLFKAKSAKSYESVYSNLTDIQLFNPYFSFNTLYSQNIKDKSWTLITNDSSVRYIKLFKYDEKTHKVLSGPENSYNYDNNDLGLISVNNNIDENKPNIKYNRDVLEFLYRQTFDENSENKYYSSFFKDFGSTTVERYTNVMKAIINKDAKVNKLTDAQMHALVKYNTTIQEYLKDTGFWVLNNSDKIQLLNTQGQLAVDKNGKPVYSSVIKPGTILGQSFTKDFEGLAYQNTIPQKPIYSWGQSWGLGPFFSLFVYPMAWITASIRNPLPPLGGWTTILAIIIAVVLTRIIALAFTWKATISQSRQEELKQKKAKIDAKYADFKGNKQMKARQQQEVQQLYKKHGINPIDSIVSLFITLPIFIAMWRVIQSVPALKSTHWLGMDFSATSWKKLIFEGQWQYFGLLLIAAASQILSQITPRLLNRKRLKKRITIEEAKAIKKSNKTQNIMMVVFLVITVLFSAGVQIYWIFTSIWSILQTLIIHRIKKSKFYRRKYLSKVQI